MTLYTFPDPRADVAARLNAAKPSRFPTATISTAFPSTAITVPHIQHAWDGTPSQESNREFCTIRVTVWTPKGQVTAGIDLASLVQAVLLDSGSSSVWRYTRGLGRTPGTDPDTGLPFCTFTVGAETRPQSVA
jgi:hypothetical protein